jgi:hypothetical protein
VCRGTKKGEVCHTSHSSFPIKIKKKKRVRGCAEEGILRTTSDWGKGGGEEGEGVRRGGGIGDDE